VLLMCCAALAMVSTASSQAAGGCSTGATTFSYTGAEQCYTVPAGVVAISVVATGAPGLPTTGTTPTPGGRGALVSGVLRVTAGETLYLEVGGSGTAAGAFNGGGSGGGGGASDVRTCSVAAGICTGTTTLDSRLLVAAGGGGAGGPGLEGGCFMGCFSAPTGTGGAGGDAGASPAAGSAGASRGGGFAGGSGGGAASASAGGTGGAGAADVSGLTGTISASTGGTGGNGSLGAGGGGGAGGAGTGGGGGGGYFGGGGGGGGEDLGALGSTDETPGGGGGAGTSFVAPSAQFTSIATAQSAASPAVTIVPLPGSTLAYTGPITGDYHDPVWVSARLASAIDGTGLAGEVLQFKLASQACSSKTDTAGIAGCELAPGDDPSSGPSQLTVNFDGDGHYAQSATSRAFTVTREEATLSYDGPSTAENGKPLTMTGTLLEDGTTPPAPAGRIITFTLGSGATADSCEGATDAGGHAHCTVHGVQQQAGMNVAIPVSVSVSGDDYYQASAPALAAVGIASHTLAIRLTGGQYGKVTSLPAGIDCGVYCLQRFADGAQVTLIAQPGRGGGFAGWSGAGCRGTRPCDLVIGADMTVSATFMSVPGLRVLITRRTVLRRLGVVRFSFRSAGAARGFQCALVARLRRGTKLRFARCRSPVTYTHLRPGTYTFLVRVRAPAGLHATPTRARFAISPRRTTGRRS
jgi:hypothetical protein